MSRRLVKGADEDVAGLSQGFVFSVLGDEVAWELDDGQAVLGQFVLDAVPNR